MKLKYKKPMPSEGGAAVPGCGTIHKSEVVATLNRLSDDLEFPFNLNNYVVGSTGKSEYSGDIDVVIDKALFDGTIDGFHKDLRSLYGSDNVSRHGSTLHLKYEIVGFDQTYAERLPRNGFVQVDFMFGSFEWESFFHYSHASESGYKGFHRNIAISSIAGATALVLDHTLDDLDRPVEVERWKWGSSGLFRIIRSSKRRTGPGWLKTQTDTVLAGPYTDRDFVATTILPIDGTPDDLNSLETVIAAIKRNYSPAMQETIFERIATAFLDKPDAHYFSYPPEIEQYFSKSDK